MSSLDINGSGDQNDRFDVNTKIKVKEKSIVDVQSVFNSLRVESGRFNVEDGDVTGDGLVNEEDQTLYEKMLNKISTFYDKVNQYYQKKLNSDDHAWHTLDKSRYKDVVNGTQSIKNAISKKLDLIKNGWIKYSEEDRNNSQKYTMIEADAEKEYSDMLEANQELYNKAVLTDMKTRFSTSLNELKADYEKVKHQYMHTRYETELSEIIAKFEALIAKIDHRIELCEMDVADASVMSNESESLEPETTDAIQGRARKIINDSGCVELSTLIEQITGTNPDNMKAVFLTIRDDISTKIAQVRKSMAQIQGILSKIDTQQEKDIYTNALSILRGVVTNSEQLVYELTADERKEAEEKSNWQFMSSGLSVQADNTRGDERIAQQSLQRFIERNLPNGDKLNSYEEVRALPYKADILSGITRLLALHRGQSNSIANGNDIGERDGILRKDQVRYLELLMTYVEQAMRDDSQDINDRINEVNRRSEQARMEGYQNAALNAAAFDARFRTWLNNGCEGQMPME